MTLPFKPHLIALVCSAGLFAASGVLYVKSRAPEAPAQAAAPAPEPTQTAVPAPVAKRPLPLRKSINGSRLSRFIPMPCFRRCSWPPPTRRTWFRPSSGREITPRCRAMPLFRRWPANRGIPASNRWSPSPVDGAYGRESAMGAKPGRCVLSPATGCDGCGAKVASTRSTNRFAKINAAANRHQRAEVQRFYRRHDDNHHIRQYASDTVDRHQN